MLQTPEKVSIDILPHQYAAMMSLLRFLCVSGGFGSGKSFGAALKAWYLSKLNIGFPGMLISRTSSQLSNLITECIAVFQRLGMKYVSLDQFRKKPQPYTFTIYNGAEIWLNFETTTTTVIHCHTTENRAYTRYAGGNRAWAVIDELDTMQEPREVWRYVNDRIRIGRVNQTAAFSTPEGFGFLWEFFHDEPQKNPDLYHQRNLIKACTFDNPYINTDYVRNQIQTRNPRSLRAYVYGEFVNLAGSPVYYRYDSTQNHTDLTLDKIPGDWILHLGVDFNRGINFTTVSVIDPATQNSFTIDEIPATPNVRYLIHEITQRYTQRHIRIYPDASGWEGIQQLEHHFGSGAVIYDPANPDIAPRVYNLNLRFRDNNDRPRHFINPRTAPLTARAITAQTLDSTGLPDKRLGFDHPADALGYSMWQIFGKNANQGIATVYR